VHKPIAEVVALRGGRVEKCADQIPFLCLATPAKRDSREMPPHPGVMSQSISGMPHRDTLRKRRQNRKPESAPATPPAQTPSLPAIVIAVRFSMIWTVFLIEPNLPIAVIRRPLIEFAQIVACAEVCPAPRRIRNPASSIVTNYPDRTIEFIGELFVESVMHLGPVESDRGTSSSRLKRVSHKFACIRSPLRLS